MGSLFWKFFLAFLLAQVLAAIAMTVSIDLFDDVWGTHPPGHGPFLPAGPMPGEPDPFAPWAPEGPPGPPPGGEGFGPPFHEPPLPPPPYLPMLGILLGCLAASALLACSNSKFAAASRVSGVRAAVARARAPRA